MKKKADLKSYYDEALKCVRCGLCQAVCPVFAVDREESAVARGKVQLVRALLENRVEAGSPIRERLFTCLNCDACTANCPSGVAVTEVILGARAQMVADLGQPAVERIVLREVLARPGRLELGAAALALYERTGLRWLAHKTGLLSVLPGGLAEKEALLPGGVNATPARKSLPQTKPEGAPRARVAYFLGCVTNVMYPEVARAVVEVLVRNGCEVVVPSELRCCGMPHANYGDLETAARLEEHNSALFAKLSVEAIVTDCATCGSTLRRYDGLGIPVYDVSEFLTEHLGLVADPRPVRERVTYHDPCHLVRGQGVKAPPRKVIQSVPEVEFMEMAEADRCCGGAGTFALLHYDYSAQILDRKMDNAVATGASTIATSCPACRMQLAHGLYRHARRAAGETRPRRVAHPLELLAEAYRGG